MENKKKTNNNTNKVAVVLGILLLAVLGYAFYSDQEHASLQNELEEERIVIKDDLDALIDKFNEKIAENTDLSEELAKAKDTILLYRDSLLRARRANYSLIKKYKNKVVKLQEKNEELFDQVEDLLAQNIALNTEIEQLNDTINGQKLEAGQLKSINSLLESKVKIAAELEVDSLGVQAIKRYSSGKLKETKRYKRTDMFKIGFKIEANPLTPKGTKKAYIIVKNPEGKIIGYKGNFKLGDREIPYSDETSFRYANKETEVILMTKVNKEANIKGMHTISVVLDGKLVATEGIKLR